MIDEQKILDQLVTSVSNSFDTMKDKSSTTEIIGYGILSDDSASSFTPIAATRNGLENFNSGNQNDFKFNPENWDLGTDIVDLKNNYNFLDALEDECEDYDNDGNWHEEYRSRIYQLIVRTFEKLKLDDYFNDDTYLMVWVVDSELPIYRAKAWSKRLNNSKTHILFTEWLDTYADVCEIP